MRAGGRSAAGDEGVGWVAWGRGACDCGCFNVRVFRDGLFL